MIQRWSSDDPAVSQRTPLDDFPCLGWRQITPGSPSGILTENGGSPCGRLWFFFCQLHPKFPRVAERRSAGDRAASHGTLADELICETLADRPANFNCELNLPDDCRTSARWVLYWRITAGFLPDLMQKSPRGDPIGTSILTRWKWYLHPKQYGPFQIVPLHSDKHRPSLWSQSLFLHVCKHSCLQSGPYLPEGQAEKITHHNVTDTLKKSSQLQYSLNKTSK